MSRKKDFFKTVAVFLLLTILTLLLLEIPRGYYHVEEERSMEKIHVQRFSVTSLEEKMSTSQKIHVFEISDGIVSDVTELNMTEEEKNTKKNEIAGEIRKMMGNKKVGEDLADFFLSQEDLDWLTMRIVQIEDEKIYSFDIGVYIFQCYDSYDMNLVIFDMETGKVFFLQMYSEELAQAFERMASAYDSDTEMKMVFADWLSSYFGKELLPEDTIMGFTDFGLRCSPFSYETFDGTGTRSTFYKVLSKLYDIW